MRHNLQQALMVLTTCEAKYWQESKRYAPNGSCFWTADDTAGIAVRVQWASASGFGARATRAGDRADCIYVVGWTDSSDFMFTSRDHRGATPGGPVCDGDTDLVTDNWRTYDTRLIAGQLNVLVRRLRQYRDEHAHFPTQADLPSINARLHMLWLEPGSWALESTPSLSNGIHCAVWDGDAGTHTLPHDQRGAAIPVGVAVCDSSDTAVR